MYEAGLKNENFVLLYKLNQNNSIAVKTPYGLTERFNVHNNIMQGTVFGPLAWAVLLKRSIVKTLY